jgi:Fe-S cluster assembly protein SufD
MTSDTVTQPVTTEPTMRATFVPEIPEALAAAATALRAASASPALQAFRAAAWEAFARLGVPATKHEDFSYVSAADLKAALTRVPPAPMAAMVEGDGGAATIALDFSDGNLTTFAVPEHVGLFALAEGDLPDSVREAWTAVAASETDIPASLAWSLARQPLALHIPKGVKTTARLHLTSTSTRADIALFMRLEANAEVEVILENDLALEAFSNTALAFSLAPGAKLRVLQADSAAGLQMLKLRFDVDRDAKVECLSVSTGSRLARLTLEANLNAPGADLDLRGAIALNGTNRAHRHLRIRHAEPHCTSNQLFKAVVLGSARSSVDGTVIVDRGAQQTDARQLLQHQILSPEGRADAKPRLLIHADDVKCSHGATVGKTDPAQLFYLRSRGLDTATANALLTQAFLGEALAIAPEAVRRAAWDTLATALSHEATS